MVFGVSSKSSFVLIPNQGNQYRYSGKASRLSYGPFWVLTQAESGHQALTDSGQSLFKDVCAHSGCVLVQGDTWQRQGSVGSLMSRVQKTRMLVSAHKRRFKIPTGSPFPNSWCVALPTMHQKSSEGKKIIYMYINMI